MLSVAGFRKDARLLTAGEITEIGGEYVFTLVRDLTFLRRWRFKLRSSGLWRGVVLR